MDNSNSLDAPHDREDSESEGEDVEETFQAVGSRLHPIEPYQFEPDASSGEDDSQSESMEEDTDNSRLQNRDW